MAEIPSSSSPLAQLSHRGQKRFLPGAQLGSPPATRPRLHTSEPEHVVGSSEPASPETEHLATRTAETDVAYNVLDDSTHSDLDKLVVEYFEDEPFAHQWLLNVIVATSGGRLNRDYENALKCKTLLRENPSLKELLQKAWENKQFKEIRNLKILQMPSSITPVTSTGDRNNPILQLERYESPRLAPELSQEATIKSWSHPYQGNVAELLFKYMDEHEQVDLYARLLAIVQSSGMGKSRMIDELAKNHFVIPLNLRSGFEGYPAPDIQVRDWLLRPINTAAQSQACFTAFLTAIFEETVKVISDPEAQIRQKLLMCRDLTPSEKEALLEEYANLSGQENLPAKFRLFTTAGQKFDKQGELRRNFYHQVLERADQLLHELVLPESINEQSHTDEFESDPVQGTTVDVKVLKKLMSFLNGNQTVIMAWDEAEVLCQSMEDSSTGKAWSRYVALRRALRSIREYRVWSLFLATAGKLGQFTPPPHMSMTGRLVRGLLHIAIPFSALGFDQLSEEFRNDGTMTLDDVSSPKFRISLGRPLWKTRYEQGGQKVRGKMIEFAIEKLLCRPYDPDFLSLGYDELFAIFSRRLALDFDTTGIAGELKQEIEINQMKQVEKHMRVCLGVQEGFETVVTAAASEPILSEAAGKLMQWNFNSCRMLSKILEWPGMYRLMFRERELRSPIVPVISFFKNLFTRGIYEEQIRDAKPSRLRQACDDRAFHETFARANFYITHFIKVHDLDMLSSELLMYYAVRGVAVVCANGQPGVDLALPTVYKDKVLKIDNMTVTLFQSRNIAKYPNVPKAYVFTAMNPHNLGTLTSDMKNPPPIIRMVFSLAAREPIVHVMKHGVRPYAAREAKEASPFGKYAYSSYDIWCGPASSSTFGTIRPEDDVIYQKLLAQTKPVRSMFKPKAEYLESSLRSMHPCATSNPSHWQYSRITLSADAGFHEQQAGGELDNADEDVDDSEHDSNNEELTRRQVRAQDNFTSRNAPILGIHSKRRTSLDTAGEQVSNASPIIGPSHVRKPTSAPQPSNNRNPGDSMTAARKRGSKAATISTRPPASFGSRSTTRVVERPRRPPSTTATEPPLSDETRGRRKG